MAHLINAEIKDYIDKLGSSFPGIGTIWLLGSRANNEARPESDWDFLVFADAQTFVDIKAAVEFKKSDVDLLIVHDGTNFEEPWPEPTDERPGPKHGNLTRWAWSEKSTYNATYCATKEGTAPRTLTAIRIWPDQLGDAILNQ